MTGDWRSPLRKLDVEDDGECRAQVVEELVDAALTAAANPYPRGWFKADGPLPDGWWWWRFGAEDENPEVLHVTNGIIVDAQPSDSIGAQWLLVEHADFSGEWCGPIPLPPADPLPDAAAGANR